MYLVLSVPCIVCTLHCMYLVLSVPRVLPPRVSCISHSHSGHDQSGHTVPYRPVGTHCCTISTVLCCTSVLLKSISFSINHSTQFMNRLNTFAETVERAGRFDQYLARYWPWQEFKVFSASRSTQCALFAVEPIIKSDFRNEIEDSCNSCNSCTPQQVNRQSIWVCVWVWEIQYGGVCQRANNIWEMNAFRLHLRSAQVAAAKDPGRINVWQRTKLPFKVLAPAFYSAPNINPRLHSLPLFTALPQLMLLPNAEVGGTPQDSNIHYFAFNFEDSKLAILEGTNQSEEFPWLETEPFLPGANICQRWRSGLQIASHAPKNM